MIMMMVEMVVRSIEISPHPTHLCYWLSTERALVHLNLHEQKCSKTKLLKTLVAQMAQTDWKQMLQICKRHVYINLLY